MPFIDPVPGIKGSQRTGDLPSGGRMYAIAFDMDTESQTNYRSLQ